jgi:hypothetical protein
MLNTRKIIVAILDLICSQSFVQISPCHLEPGSTLIDDESMSCELSVIILIYPLTLVGLYLHTNGMGVNIEGIEYK